ncbi:MAG: ABC transporter permease [Lachnospiraceae bacterium]|nr:ABC transporter permease [Lachnospiraceae bacterium]
MSKQNTKKTISMSRRKTLLVRLYILVFLAAILLILAGIGAFITPNDPYKINALMMKKAPSPGFLFGTDSYGRCVCSRVLAGAGLTIYGALILVISTAVTGTILGTVCGYYGGILDTVIMRITDLMLAFPQMVLAIAVAGLAGGGLWNAILALGITGWTLYCRLVRSRVMSIKHEPYILAARLSGCSDLKIIVSYILPMTAGTVVVNAVTQMGTSIIWIAGLSFLGIGVRAPQAEWGNMINEARGTMQLAPWAVLAPCAAIFITVTVFNFLGDTVRDLAD